MADLLDDVRAIELITFQAMPISSLRGRERLEVWIWQPRLAETDWHVVEVHLVCACDTFNAEGKDGGPSAHARVRLCFNLVA